MAIYRSKNRQNLFADGEWNSDGQKVRKVLAYEACTGKNLIHMVLTDSGWTGFALGSGGSNKEYILGFPVDNYSSGEIMDVVVGGYIEDVNIGNASTSAQSTFTAGETVRLSSGYIYSSGGATMADMSLLGYKFSTGSQIGIALSSGETYEVDLYLFPDRTVYTT